MICKSCDAALKGDKIPPHALANGFWLGKVPPELQELTFAEKLLVARVRHNRCVVRVASGRVKMMANVIMFSNPTPLIYNVLPPPKDELDEVLAFVYTGSSMPTEDEKTRTPLLVRRNTVARALDWLKLNHSDYQDLEISQENLSQYPEYGVPFIMEYHEASGTSNRDPLTVSMHDQEEEDGTSEGPCPFTVHGLTGAEYSTMSTKTMKALALRHLQSGGKVLGIGHEGVPESMYDNPQAYPKMFPWLFPFGYGGIGQRHMKGKISSTLHKRNLLMYHDKRFQTDVHFPIVAFNHNQMKNSITGSFLTAKRADFPNIADRLARLNPDTLINIAGRMLAGEVVKPSSESEKLCFSLLNDIDHIGGHVDGSLSTKKQRRNELWSLMASKGAPMWFLTFSPADVKHPLCIYYAGKRLDYQPNIPLSAEERKNLISENPVAAARFFHFMVEAFIRNILGVGSEESGLFGDTDAYYGMVEQQGRLTLHLHVLLWIAGSPSPQEIRERLMAGDQAFQDSLINYLESVHTGDFLAGTKDDVSSRVQDKEGAVDATLCLPPLPPKPCEHENGFLENCDSCQRIEQWYETFQADVDKLLLRSNIHTCRASAKEKGATNGPKGCLSKDGLCAARFPRELFFRTIVDMTDGHIDMKKTEAWMNTVAPLITYSMRSNTDCTCLLSGTAIKSVIIYVTDYVVKQTLKSHQIFSTAYAVLNRNETVPEGDESNLNSARRTLLKIVNSLSTKLEIGSPMASMYLLGNPDHYTSHSFVPFYWKSYVMWARREVNVEEQAPNDSLPDDDDLAEPENVEIGQNDRRYYEKSKVHDYIFRPAGFDNICLWNWVQCYTVRKRTPKDIASLKYLLKYVDANSEVELGADEEAIVPDKIRSLTADQKRQKLAEFKSKSFTSMHPLFLTHNVTFDPELMNVNIPNILGGGMPRSDTGDREFYCSSMLALFKPWRTGQDLIASASTWEEAYDQHHFTTRQRQLLSNFNLRYECLDARDDYSAKRKAAQAARFLENRDFGGDGDTSDSEFDEEVVQERVRTMDDHIREAFEKHSPTYSENIRRRFEIDRMLLGLGLVPDTTYNEAYDNAGPSLGPTSASFALEKYRTPAAWKAIVKVARETLLHSLMQNTTQNTSALNGEPLGSYVGGNEQLRLLDSKYFLRAFKARTQKAQDIIDFVAEAEKLNAEQERAFRLIANHASSLAPQQLKMYIGGMAGTGKSRVVHAVKKFFEMRKEDGRYIVVAPTGTAAAQLHGSTYHSLLGFSVGSDDDKEEHGRSNNQTSLRAAQERLKGVEYIIFDEISMVPCHDLYKISARFSEIRNNPDEIFGGLNVIVLGDFAQLSPVHGKSLYNGKAMDLSARSKLMDQEAFLGRAIWHQFTTVVMLVQNMRQLQQSTRDAQFRTCLTNMRYGACTDEDIHFLQSLIVRQESDLHVKGPEFRNSAVITCFNAQRDRFNEIGVERFARDTNQRLYEFYSEDALAIREEEPTKKRKRRKRVKVCSFSPETQEKMWSVPPSATSKHIPGKLLLCKGLPVVIRNNDATELCITKGQPATVVGWDARSLPCGKQTLNTLFVKLVDPPKNVEFEGLPENVVPLPTKLSPRLYVRTPSGDSIAIKRWQVPVLPFFGMTDYTSQGKTRKCNVVHILHSPTHQAVYTALSRGTTADGTAILYGFDRRKIQGGMSGFLRQEFRELEILNKMTEFRYLKKIPEDAITDIRSTTLMNYNRLRKDNPDLRVVWPKALTEDSTPETLWDNVPILTDANENKRLIVEYVKSSSESKVKSKQSKNPRLPTKRARRDPPTQPLSLMGPTWDSQDFSCAYDSVLFILANLYNECRATERKDWKTVSPLVNNIIDCLEGNSNEPNVTRNMLRNTLHTMDPESFPKGQRGVDIEHLISAICGRNDDEDISYLSCHSCNSTTVTSCFHLNTIVYPEAPSAATPVSFRDQWVARDTNSVVCHHCLLEKARVEYLDHPKFAQRLPPFICVPLVYGSLIIDDTLVLENQMTQYTLKGMIYHGDFHFIAAFRDSAGEIWKHDGMKGRMAEKLQDNDAENRWPVWLDGKFRALAIFGRHVP
ncbi:hypothetical protein CVT26_007746 [Gymnopilus dilepis]|uniref:ATP-dependent DNA helicase n=1 Tax=Gymnopilus dilepis TaxID=231916 RepID=A0A409WSK4_9AGAR|nr:hypothetical protein CVT26_007746 [Gymnopilus dilepis]